MKKNSTDSRKARAMLTVSQVLVYALLIFLSVLCLFSFYMLIVNASRTNADLQGGAPLHSRCALRSAPCRLPAPAPFYAAQLAGSAHTSRHTPPDPFA